VGIALLVAPVSGANLRAMLLGGVKGEAVKAEARVHDVVKKAETRMEGVADVVASAMKGAPEESPTNHKSTRA
jgi:gas vesicle protein